MSSGSSTIAEAAALLLQTPPGQTSKVYHDLRALLESGGASNVSVELKKAAAPVLEQYNTEQLITVKPEQAAASGSTEAGQAADRPIIISRAAEVPGQAGRYADPRAKLSYAFDHLRLSASDPKPLLVNKTFEQVRAAIDEKVSKYVADHFRDGVTSTCTVIKPDPAQAARVAAAASSKAEVVKVDEEKAEEKRKEAQESAHDEPAVSTGAAGTAEEDKAEANEETDKEPEAAEKASAEEDDPVEAVKAAEEVEKAAESEKAAAGEVAKEEEEDEEPQGEPTYVTHIVGNRYNLNNFWAGRWRSSYTYTPSTSGAPAVLTSSIQVQVHYFEDGNVQLAASRPYDIPLELPSSSSGGASGSDGEEAQALGTAIALAIRKHESAYHEQLDEAYGELSERAFKAIRRQLPVTKQKLDWDKALNYKIASQLNK